MAFEPIAIVGRSCLLPGALNPQQFAEAVLEGRDLLSEAPADRWGVPPHLALTDDPSKAADRAWTARGGYVRGWEGVRDAADPFPMGDEALRALDPLFQWVLLTGREALRDAGHTGSGERVGAVMGNLSFPASAMSRFAEQVWLDRPEVDPRNRFMSGLPAHLLAEQLGLGAGAFALDAACASSLYAIKLACDKLHDRDADVMLAGAVCRSDDLFIHVGFCALNAMSKTGRSRPFHAGADGLVPAEGAAFVALKRLTDAERDGDRILGVIRGVGLSNDGRGRGLLAPSSDGQARALADAWAMSGCDPKRLGLAECHATGTTVGDAAELETMARVLGEHVDGRLPIGSLKSNLGHLITTAGVAGLLKVLAGFEAGVRPPTLHLDDPNPKLAALPFRVVTAPEPWESDGPRLASVSAFGFGGNNAHLVVEEYAGPVDVPATPRPTGPVAVVAMGARVAKGESLGDFAHDLFEGTYAITPGVPARGTAEQVRLPMMGLRFPPNDLASTLPQQLMVLAAAMEAAKGLELPHDRTGVLVGSQSDPEVARYGARWRLRGWHEGADPAWMAAATDAVVPVLDSAGVVGNMPNIPANRVGSQLDLGGPGYTVASEELSGVQALRIGLRALRSGELDVALVGGVDLSAEPVHEAATAAVIGPRTAGDAAVVLVLKRLADAEAEGLPVLAVFDEGIDDAEPLDVDLGARFGHAHAADGLLRVAAGVLACAHGLRPRTEGPADADATRRVQVDAHAFTGATDRFRLRGHGPVQPMPERTRPTGPTLDFPAHPPVVVLPPRGPEEASVTSMPAAPSLVATTSPTPSMGQATGFENAPAHTMTAAPALPPTNPDLVAPEPLVTPKPPVPATAPRPSATLGGALGHVGASAPTTPAPALPQPVMAASLAPSLTPALPAPMPSAPPAGLSGASGHLASLHAQLAAVHQQYLRQQADVHLRFLQVRQATLQQLIQARGIGSVPQPTAPAWQPAPPAVPESTLPALNRAHKVPTRPAPAPAAKPVPAAAKPAPKPAPAAPKPAPKPAPVAAKPAAKAESPKATVRAAADRRWTTAPVNELPGPKWGRDELEVLASDKISKVFGEMFTLQDDFPRQVRMPEPPLLLCDRVVGLDAEPGSMTTGAIYTETDVTWDGWYLHDGHMPAGVMIEAGQADLLLISWLGADFQNKGERVYRLLGCELTYRGGLPTVGDTLRYGIHIDGHANQGDTRIFFFHYDCVVDGKNRLEVRQGQAGFFSDAELANSGGILWKPEEGEHDRTARLDGPKIDCTRSSFSEEQVLAFANGDGFTCFGEGFEYLQTHVRTPRIAPPPMVFWKSVSQFDPKGGPWGRGYLRCEQPISPDDWFFDGHFKDDPCMPGTMMFEACLHALGFYMAALGYTVDKDGWRFEPVPDIPYQLKCRGQVTPESKHQIYEIFIEEVHDGPHPMVYADFLCTVDGLKAFHARRVGLVLKPDWPISSRPEILDGYVDPVPVAEADGFPFGYHSLIACAWGRPSEAFGPMYTPFDEGRHCARLPGPPYHFMTRVTKIDGPIGGMKIGTAIELEYDVPPEAWYFDANGCASMPYAVLLEAALQPCGWIACFVGSALTTDEDLFFRNLDGTATWHTEVLPTSGTLRTEAKITAISHAGGMIIEGFQVECYLGDTHIYTMKTVFGFFPRESLANQVGMPPSQAERDALHAPSDYLVDLTSRPEKYCGGALRLPDPMLLMLDRVSGYWPEGGKAGLGKLRSEKDVDPSEWFFKAHFYTDPVQPGSLGIEAMIQLLQFYMLENGMGDGMENPRFEPLMMGRELSWKYRGQVVPKNKVIYCEMDITEVGEDDRGRYAICDAYLWVDKLRIYQAIGMGMRIVDDALPPRDPNPGGGPGKGEEVIEPTGWVGDHRPTFTVPALPAMSMVDRIAGAAQATLGGPVTEVRDVQVLRWVPVAEPTRLRTVVTEHDGTEAHVTLEAWREAGDPALSRFEAVAKGVASVRPSGPAPTPWDVQTGEAVADPYASGHLFHGPAFHYLTEWVMGDGGASATLDARAGSVPHGTLGQGLLDALTHVLPHDDVHRWDASVPADQVAYPYQVKRLAVFGPRPTGTVRVEARYAGLQGERHPTFRLQAIDTTRGAVWVEAELVEVLFPKGPIGNADRSDRLAFLRDRSPVEGLALSTFADGSTTATAAAVKQSDWLPGTVRSLYEADGDLVEAVAVADHIAAKAGVHPGTVERDGDVATTTVLPYTWFPIEVTRDGAAVTVRDAGPEQLDLSPVQLWWDDWFDIGRWPVEDLYYGLMERFIRRVVTPDPEGLASIHGQSVLYLANHQVGVESLLFSVLASALNGMSTVTLAKIEHQQTWLGRLIGHSFQWPGARDPQVITFFDRSDKASLPRIIGELSAQMTGTGKSVMVHVEGTRSLHCRRPPVEKMSSAFIDMALRNRVAIVPVRFSGSLPTEALDARNEFPTGMGQQDIWLGTPIRPEQLEAMPFKERKDHVIGAINALGPDWHVEEPLPGDPAMLQRSLERAAATGAEPAHAALLEVLLQREPTSDGMAAILDGARSGHLELPDTAEGRWLRDLAARLYGPKGPTLS